MINIINNTFVKKLIHNKIFLFVIPNLISFFPLLFHYNNTFSYSSMGEILFYEIIILEIILVIINSIIYYFLKKTLKNYHKVFLIMCFITISYSCFSNFDLIGLLLYIMFILILIFNFKKFIKFKLDYFVMIISFMGISLFSYNFITSLINFGCIVFKSKNYHYEFDIKVKNETSTPNIYWIHCDGMMNFKEIEDYFNYDDIYLKNYFNYNSYTYNKGTSLIVGHRTQNALVAMFNPYYYNNFFKEYLLELNNSFINGEKTSYMVDFDELEEKRLNNELFKALGKNNYLTIGIGDFNQYTGLYTDYYYDYYIHDKNGRQVLDRGEVRYIDKKNNSNNKLLACMRFNHFKTIMSTTMFYSLFKEVNFLDYEIKNYNDINNNEFNYINNTAYWPVKGIVKGIEESADIKGPKFMFIDFKLNHLPIIFNSYGKEISLDVEYNLNYYLGNYIYSTRLLTEILDYIKKMDNEAVIFVQGDHGIHMLENEYLMNYFNIPIEEVYDIRNSVISAYYIPDKYKNGDEQYLDNPLNISRYIVNNYVGKNYDYIKEP